MFFFLFDKLNAFSVPFCPCFIRDCGHIQPNENEILEYSSKKRKTSALNLSVDQKVEMSSRLNSIVDIITHSKPLSRDPIPVAPKAISIKPTKKVIYTLTYSSRANIWIGFIEASYQE